MTFQLPHSKLGKWSVILVVISLASLLFAFWPEVGFLPFFTYPLIGLIAGIIGLNALVRGQERSVFVLLAIPLGFAGIGFFIFFVYMIFLGAFS